jgi:hypothetical protein
MRKLYNLPLAICLVFSIAFGLDTVAVLKFTSSSFPEDAISTITNKVVQLMVAENKFIVIDRRHTESVLKEQMLQQTGCTDTSCAVKLGRLLNARYIFTGELNNLSGILTLMINQIDVSTGQVVNTYEAKCNNCLLNEFYSIYLNDILKHDSYQERISNSLTIVSDRETAIYIDNKYFGNVVKLDNDKSEFGLEISNLSLGYHSISVCSESEAKDANENSQAKYDYFMAQAKQIENSKRVIQYITLAAIEIGKLEKCHRGQIGVDIDKNSKLILHYNNLLFVKDNKQLQ